MDNIGKIYTVNYPPIFRKVEEDLKTWSRCGLSWLGRINAKMTLLPRLLYLFHSLPIQIKEISLYNLQSKIISFVWGKKGLHCSTEVLFHRKSQVGLGLSNLWWYYQAAQLAQFSMVYLEDPNLIGSLWKEKQFHTTQ